MTRVDIQPFFDDATRTVSYVVADPASKQAAVIDPVADLDAGTGQICSQKADQLIAFLDKSNLDLEWILETSAHPDRLAAARYFKDQRGGKIGISEHNITCESGECAYLFQDGEVVYLGHVEMEVITTPGQSSACASYRIEDTVFVGNTLLMPEAGTAHAFCTHNGVGAQRQLRQRILALPDSTRVFFGYDRRPPSGESFICETTILEEKRRNIHLKSSASGTELQRLDTTVHGGI